MYLGTNLEHIFQKYYLVTNGRTVYSSIVLDSIPTEVMAKFVKELSKWKCKVFLKSEFYDWLDISEIENEALTKNILGPRVWSSKKLEFKELW